MSINFIYYYTHIFYSSSTLIIIGLFGGSANLADLLSSTLVTFTTGWSGAADISIKLGYKSHSSIIDWPV